MTIHTGEEPDISPDASLTERPTVELAEDTSSHSFLGRYVWRFIAWSAAFIYGLVALVLAPRFFAGVLETMPRYGLSIGIGAAVLMAVPVVIVIVCLTLVGLPLGLVSLAVYGLAVYSAQVFVGAWIGQALLGPAKSTGESIGRLALGLALIHIVVLLPIAGGLVSLAVAVWGVGALTLRFFGRRPEPVPA